MTGMDGLLWESRCGQACLTSYLIVWESADVMLEKLCYWEKELQLLLCLLLLLLFCCSIRLCFMACLDFRCVNEQSDAAFTGSKKKRSKFEHYCRDFFLRIQHTFFIFIFNDMLFSFNIAIDVEEVGSMILCMAVEICWKQSTRVQCLMFNMDGQCLHRLPNHYIQIWTVYKLNLVLTFSSCAFHSHSCPLIL